MFYFLNSEDNKSNMLRKLNEFMPGSAEVSKMNILLHGPIGAGKSSFVNSVKTALQGHNTTSALADSAAGKSHSFTLKLKIHRVKKDGTFYPFVFTDIMGLEPDESKGVQTEDMIKILHGHIKDSYTFNPVRSIADNDPKYLSNPSLKDKVHCLVSVLPGDKLSLIPEEVIKRMRDVRKKARDLEIPQVVIMTMVDKVCPLVKNLSKIYTSRKVKEKVRTVTDDSFSLFTAYSRSAHVSVGGVAPQCSFRGGRCLTRRQRRRVWQHPAPALPPLGEFQFSARQTSSPRSRRSSVDVARCECSAVDVARSCCSAVDVAWSCCSAVDVIRLCGSAVDLVRRLCSAVDVAWSCCSAVDVIRLCGSAVDLVRRLCSAVDVASDPLALPSGPLLPPLVSLLLLTPPTCLALVLASPHSPCFCFSLPPPVPRPASRSPHRPLYVPSSSPGPIAGPDFLGGARMEECCHRLGVPMNCIFPVLNYHEQITNDLNMDLLILMVMTNIIQFANDYVEDQLWAVVGRGNGGQWWAGAVVGSGGPGQSWAGAVVGWGSGGLGQWGAVGGLGSHGQWWAVLDWGSGGQRWLKWLWIDDRRI
ncbi:hypothetical protein QTP86_032195, partial [Hemibagrus guttatus]